MSFHARLDARFTVPPQGRASYIRHLHTALRDDNFRVLVADARGEIRGYVLGYVGQNPPMFPQTRYGFIADLCVTSTLRRQGVGTGLVRHLPVVSRPGHAQHPVERRSPESGIAGVLAQSRLHGLSRSYVVGFILNAYRD